MSEEAEVVNTETPSDAPAESVQATEAPSQPKTIEDVARKYKIPEAAKNFNPKLDSPVNREVETRYIPDPNNDPEGYSKYQAFQETERQKYVDSLKSQVERTSKVTLDIARQLHEQRLDNDIKSAVSHVNDQLNVDADLVEAALNARHDKDPIFKQIWENRSSNPKALKEALDVITSDLKGKFAVRVDSKVSEDVRAMKAVGRGQQTASKADDDSALLNLPTDKFLRKVREMSGRN